MKHKKKELFPSPKKKMVTKYQVKILGQHMDFLNQEEARKYMAELCSVRLFYLSSDKIQVEEE